MGSFQFRDKTISVDIAGNTFSFECNTEIGDRLTAYSKECAALAKEIEAGDKTNADAVDLCKKLLDAILGDKASDAIFAVRVPDVLDCVDILMYLVDEVKEFKRKRDASINRAQRRAAK